MTVQGGAATVTLRLEGRVSGLWVTELKRAWGQVASSLGSRKLKVDLNGVTHMDRDAKAMLAEIHKATSAEFLANAPFTQYFIAELGAKKS